MFKDIGGGHLGDPDAEDIQNVKELLEALYNDDEDKSLLDKYDDIKNLVTNEFELRIFSGIEY